MVFGAMHNNKRDLCVKSPPCDRNRLWSSGFEGNAVTFVSAGPPFLSQVNQLA